VNDLRGIAVDKRKSGTENLVTAYYFIQASLEDGDIQRTDDTEANSNIPSGVARCKPIKIPQRLLGAGRGKRVFRIGEASPDIVELVRQSASFSQTN
jgi:hypothetical protein